MKFLLNSLLIAGALMSHTELAFAQETRLTQGYLSRIMSDARKTFNVPAIAATVMNSETILLQEVRFSRNSRAKPITPIVI
jgi:hypothetical protein